MNLQKRIENANFTPGILGVKRFRAGTTSATTPGERSRLARIQADSARALLQGPDNPFKLVLPAYESFTSDGTGGNTETLNLSHNLYQSPNTNDVVAYVGGSITSVDATDYANDTIDVTDPGSDNTIHVFYSTDATGDVELVKAAPSGKADSSKEIDSATLHHIHRQDQNDQPHYLTLDKNVDEWFPTDFALEIYVNAEYTVALEDPDGDGAVATNALFQIPAQKANDSIPGLSATVRDAM